MTHTFSICSLIKNEVRYIGEWISFHKKQGVEHFYLYDNGSDDNTKEMALSYENVTLLDFPMTSRFKQFFVFNDALSRYKLQSDWIAFMDADEFLFCPDGTKLPERIAKYQGASGVAVHWVMYGSGGKLEYENAPITTRFTMRAKEVNKHCKSIIKTKEGLCVGSNPHTFRTLSVHGISNKIVDERMRRMPLEYAVTDDGTVDKLRINHYHVKSYEEAKLRWPLRTQFHYENERTWDRFEESFKAHDTNEIHDPILVDWQKK